MTTTTMESEHMTDYQMEVFLNLVITVLTNAETKEQALEELKKLLKKKD